MKLDKVLQAIPFKSLQGLIAAGMRIKRAAQKGCPVDTGNLKASAFVVWSGGGLQDGVPKFTTQDAQGVEVLTSEQLVQMGQDHIKIVNEAQTSLPLNKFKPAVILGFTAFYAIFVEEDDEADHSQSGGGGAHYFRNAIDGNLLQIGQDVAEASKVA